MESNNRYDEIWYIILNENVLNRRFFMFVNAFFNTSCKVFDKYFQEWIIDTTEFDNMNLNKHHVINPEQRVSSFQMELQTANVLHGIIGDYLTTALSYDLDYLIEDAKKSLYKSLENINNEELVFIGIFKVYFVNVLKNYISNNWGETTKEQNVSLLHIKLDYTRLLIAIGSLHSLSFQKHKRGRYFSNTLSINPVSWSKKDILLKQYNLHLEGSSFIMNELYYELRRNYPEKAYSFLKKTKEFFLIYLD